MVTNNYPNFLCYIDKHKIMLKPTQFKTIVGEESVTRVELCCFSPKNPRERSLKHKQKYSTRC